MKIKRKEHLTAIYHRLWPQHIIGEILLKRWMESVITFSILVIVTAFIGFSIDGYFSVSALTSTMRQFGELGFLILAMAIVMMAGGIDLSVGAIYALANILVLILVNKFEWPIYAAIPLVLLMGGIAGMVNGFLIGVLRLRAFLTTLVTLVIFRAIYEMLLLSFAADVCVTVTDSDFWVFIGEGKISLLPFSIFLLIITGIILHILLSRSRPGWRILSIGGSRRAAHSAGIPIKRTLFSTYVFSGIMCSVGGVFYAARLNNPANEVGLGIEFIVLTGVVLGGVSLGGGRGTISRALMGGGIVFLITNGMIQMGILGGTNQMVVGIMIAIAVWFDVKYQKNRHKIIDKVYVSPTYLRIPDTVATRSSAKNPYEQNDILTETEAIGLGQVDGPEDVILDRYDNLYCGTRTGDILRFSGTHFERREVFAHIGGRPLGLAFDQDGNLLSCVTGMGLYGVTPDGQVFKLTDQTNRTWLSVIDDSRICLADDLDVAPDGKIYFSEGTIRYGFDDWPLDSMEGRGNGKIICFDPASGKTRTVLYSIIFPNGICMSYDNESFFFAETWRCSVSRYWFSGPKKGKVVRVIDNMPGYPDNINRASDGNYWLAFVGMRTPVLDLAMRMPFFRRRMVKRIPGDEWIFPNMNTGCVIKFNDEGEVLYSYWDMGGKKHQTLSSMREHRGYLYLGGVNNNRIGRLKLDGADPEWVALDTYGR